MPMVAPSDGDVPVPLIRKARETDVADILEMVGTERIMANSAGDWGKSNPLAVPELIQELKRRGHPESAISKVVYDNPLAFFRQSRRWQDWTNRQDAKSAKKQTVKA